MTARQRKGKHIGNSAKKRRFWKKASYLLIVAGSTALAGWLLAPVFWSDGTGSSSGAIVEIKGTMGGFSKSVIRAKSGRPLTVRLTSVDNRFHTDGGGKHQFAIDALGVNLIAPPLGTREVTFTPSTPGVYEYYCDICCGGRVNPTMVGKLIVEA